MKAKDIQLLKKVKEDFMDKERTESFNTEKVYIINALLNFIKAIPDLALNVDLEELSNAPSMMLKQLNKEFKTAPNILGGYKAEFPFSLTIRKSKLNDQTSSSTLFDLADYFEDHYKELSLGSNKICEGIKLVTYPTLEKRSENEEEDYTAEYVLLFKYNKNKQ